MSDELVINDPTRPAFLATKEKTGMGDVQKHLIPPVVRIIQKMSSDKLQAKFAVGQVVVLPEEIVIADPDEACIFIPVHFYVEYCAWNPRKYQETEGSLKTRSFDPNSEVAKIACDPERRNQLHPDGSSIIKYQEHLNFMMLIQHANAPKIPCVMSFSSTGHMDGRSFCNLISAREAAVFAGKYTLKPYHRKNSEGDWYGISVENAGWCTEEEYDLAEKVNGELAAAQIRTDYGEDEDTGE